MDIRKVYRDTRRLFRQSSMVLMYHRIAAPAVDPWQLAVSPEHFEQHLQVLKCSKQVVPLQQLVCNFNSRSFIKESIAITFDDGYLDNYLIAKPLLEKYDLPATFFITSRNVDLKNEFWWDELVKIVLETPELPQQCSMVIAGEPFFFDLGDEACLTEELRKLHKDCVAYEPATLRAQLYLKLWEQFTPMSAPEQQKLMERLRHWAGTAAEARAAYRCMSSEQIIDLSANNLFSIGGHTDTHPALAFHEKEVQRAEIRKNKLFLENLTNKKISLFAYPSGNYNQTAAEVLKEERFNAGFTTKYGYITRKDNPYLLNRLQVNNWDGKAFNWVVSKCFEQKLHVAH